MYLVQACILYATLLCGITFVSIDHSRDPYDVEDIVFFVGAAPAGERKSESGRIVTMTHVSEAQPTCSNPGWEDSDS